MAAFAIFGVMERVEAAGHEGQRYWVVRLRRSWVIAVVVASLAVTGSIWFGGIEPLRGGSQWWSDGPGHRSRDTLGGGHDVYLRMEPKETFSLEFEVVNDSPFAVEVLGVDHRDWATRFEGMHVGPPGRLTRTLVETFKLDRGESSLVRLNYLFADCEPPRQPTGYFVFSTVTFRYEMLGITRTQEFDLPYTVAVTGQMNPDRCESTFDQF